MMHRYRSGGGWVWMGMMAALCRPAFAETAEAAYSWRWLLAGGSWPIYILMGVLAVMSVIGAALLFYFLAILRVRQVAPPALHRELVESICGGDLRRARSACEHRPTPLAAVTLVALDYVNGVTSPDGSLLKEIMQGEGSRQAEVLEGQSRYLLDIAVVAPMVGLLGTVFGMLQAFSAVALDMAKARPMVLAGGVSQALVTTAFGLIVAIPAMIAYAYFRRRVGTLVAYLEAASTDVLTALLSARSA